VVWVRAVDGGEGFGGSWGLKISQYSDHGRQRFGGRGLRSDALRIAIGGKGGK
jgi:hypothetical protein